jgi:hypothetical protein
MTTNDVSLIRLYVLRALYLLIAVGQGSLQWPGIFHHDHPWSMMSGVAHVMLGALALMSLLGLLYPLKMLPLLFFEMAWKVIWLTAIALPLWLAGTMDAETLDTAQACLVGVIVPIAIPWRHVFETYVKAPGDRWR